MHPVCRFSKKLFLCFIVFSIPFAACTQKVQDPISLSEWIHELNQQAGISLFTHEPPYFMNISEQDPYYSDVQAAVEWQVLDPSYGFNPDDSLNREWCAYTLMNLVGKKQEESLNIKDISDSVFQSQIQAAVSSGLMNVDERNLFHPDTVMEKDEALELLSKAVSFINEREIEETVNDITWSEESTAQSVSPLFFDEETMTASFQDTDSIETGSIVSWNDETGQHYYKVSDVEEDTVFLEDVNVLEETDSIQLSGSEELDFSNAQIIDGEGNIVQETSYTNRLELISTRPLQKTFTISDFTVNITTSSSTVKAEVSKEFPHGSKLYAAVKVNGVHCDYDWDSEGTSIKDAYFKVKFHSEQDFGLKNSSYKNLYGDFSKFDANTFLSSLSSMYQAKKDVVEQTLTLCQVKVPMPSAPLVNITLALDLHLYASGKVEVVFSQNNEFGCEIRDGVPRFIHDTSSSTTNLFKASAGLSAGATFALNLASARLADISMNAGFEASMKTTLHLYTDDSHQKVETDVPADVADELSDGNPDVLVCSDLKAYPVLYVDLNSSKSTLGKFGLSERFDILSDDNASIFKNGHLENFQFVSKCTRKDREKKETMDSLKVTTKITLQEYSMIVRIGNTKKITITGLPQGYKRSDLVFSSDGAGVASVDTDGNITGVSSGSAVITITTSDSKHYIHCNVLVPME